MKRILFLLSLALLLVLAACNSEDSQDTAEQTEEEEQTEQKTEGSPEEGQVSSEKQVEPDKTVAKVNGEEIKGEEYNRLYPQVVSYLQQYGQDTSDSEAVKEQVLNELVTQQLIIQDAKAEGIEVADEEVTSEMETIKEQYGEDYAGALEASGFTEESFQQQLAKDMLRVKYIETQLDTDVSDEEVEEYYNELVANSEQEIGELSEVEGQIKNALTQQKQQEQLQPKVEELREQAEIELLI
ncbi:SurA N-terminal domain-containing protein [Gracilibacillus ureilyticus]|uniref:SurA N-terminal domain-containing protein n=1 Tax=Gracilibacillus ureilyticus TaxID=531814 RepID=A0A1H9UTG6_9BACI|nr:SurA N-terminal domain-containing protein [Gracilibacillus ureilyticus]SES12820.1 SurA N-terminal domain-containing protein [Gracilibacillus ureilyticus]